MNASMAESMLIGLNKDCAWSKGDSKKASDWSMAQLLKMLKPIKKNTLTSRMIRSLACKQRFYLIK